jgi:hypothetical protein
MESVGAPIEIYGKMNYLLKVTWPQDSTSIEAEKNLILKTLKEKLNIDSKS